jgi:hypothetical protein
MVTKAVDGVLPPQTEPRDSDMHPKVLNLNLMLSGPIESDVSYEVAMTLTPRKNPRVPRPVTESPSANRSHSTSSPPDTPFVNYEVSAPEVKFSIEPSEDNATDKDVLRMPRKSQEHLPHNLPAKVDTSISTEVVPGTGSVVERRNER